MTDDTTPIFDPPRMTEDVTALIKHDAAETARFVNANVSWMLSVARRILREQTLAEDAVQMAFVSIFKSLESFDGRSQLKTWMHRIVVNQALMILRKDRHMKTTSIDELLPEFDGNGCRIENNWTTFITPETLLQKSQTKTQISEQIDRLPEKYRTVLVLRDIEEFSTAEVAVSMGMTEANVKVTLHRARATLKILFEPLFRGQVI
ncbi:MAG: sigma-70 family RNA polymerase sigma factor [Sneathiella sp.]